MKATTGKEMHKVFPDMGTQSCQHCGKDLNPDKEVWLWLNCVTLKWTAEEPVKEDENQGQFPFGQACAQKVINTSIHRNRR